MIESIFPFMIQNSLFPSALAMLVAWLPTRPKLMFPIFWGSRIWLFVQAWIFYTVALALFASLGNVIGLAEDFQQGFAEALLPFVATVLFLRYRMWPRSDVPK